jgi:hypothetical protein
VIKIIMIRACFKADHTKMLILKVLVLALSTSLVQASPIYAKSVLSLLCFVAPRLNPPLRRGTVRLQESGYTKESSGKYDWMDNEDALNAGDSGIALNITLEELSVEHSIGWDDAMAADTRDFLLILDKSSVWGYMPGDELQGFPPTQRIEFEYHTVPPVEMEGVTNIITRLKKPENDFIVMNSPEVLMKLIESYARDPNPLFGEQIGDLLSQTFQDDDVELAHEKHRSYQFYELNTRQDSQITPRGHIHLDGHFKDETCLNLWIATKPVMGRPLSFIHSDSTTQKTGLDTEKPPTYVFDPDHKFSFVPYMEAGQIIAFLGCEVWHGSPELDAPHDGERDALVLRVILRRKSWSGVTGSYLQGI